MCRASFSKGLWGLVAILANSASQLVFGAPLSPWWDTAPTWNKAGDLWSSSTSCKSGISSEKKLGCFNVQSKHKNRFTFVTRDFLCSALYLFTIIHVAPRWWRQVLITFQRIKGLVHCDNILSCFFFQQQQRTYTAFIIRLLAIKFWGEIKQIKRSWNPFWQWHLLLSFINLHLRWTCYTVKSNELCIIFYANINFQIKKKRFFKIRGHRK